MDQNFHICLRSGPGGLTPPPLRSADRKNTGFFLTTALSKVKEIFHLATRDGYEADRGEAFPVLGGKYFNSNQSRLPLGRDYYTTANFGEFTLTCPSPFNLSPLVGGWVGHVFNHMRSFLTLPSLILTCAPQYVGRIQPRWRKRLTTKPTASGSQ